MSAHKHACTEYGVVHLPGDYCDPQHNTATVQRFFTRTLREA